MRKHISVIHGVALAISMVIGSGLLGIPGLAIERVGPIPALLAWIIIVFSIVPLVYIFSRLGVRFPSSAGIAHYVDMAFGNSMSQGVILLLCATFVIGMPAFALIGGSFIVKFLQLTSPEAPYIFACILIIISTALNLFKMRIVACIQYLNLIVLLTIIVAIISFNFQNSYEATISLIPKIGQINVSYNQIWQAAAIIFWAFQGWECLSFSLNEVENKKLRIFNIFWISYIVVSILYITLAWIMTMSYIDRGSAIGVTGMASLFSRNLYTVSLVCFSFIIMININSWIFSTSRLICSAGNKGILPKFIGDVSCDGIPQNSLLFACLVYVLVLIAAYICKIPLYNLLTLTTQNFIILYGIVVISYMMIEKHFIRRFIGLLAIISCIFLLAGFSWLIFVPITILIVGSRRIYHPFKCDENP